MTQTTSLLTGRRAIIHGGAGAIGSAIARVFARDGAQVFLTGRTLPRVEAVAAELCAGGGRAEADRVDVLDETAIEAHAESVVRRAGGVDVMVNAIGIDHVQGIGLTELSVEDFLLPVTTYVRGNFLAARAAGRQMVRHGGGVILTLSTPGARLVGRGWLGSGVAFAAVEAMSRLLAAELGPAGVRVVCLRSDAIPEALAQGSHTREVFARVAANAGLTIDEMLATRARTATLTGRLPTLEDIAETAAFLASPRARAITGAIANLTCGSLTD